MIIGRATGSAFIALLLAGCATGGSPAAPTSETAMAGRWILAAPNAPFCGMNFSSAAGAREGAVSPEGGCPGKFYMSRRWRLGDDGLTIMDENGQSLATLRYANNRYEGEAAVGIPVTLTRDEPPNAAPS